MSAGSWRWKEMYSWGDISKAMTVSRKCEIVGSITHYSEPSEEPNDLGTIPIPILQRTLKLMSYKTLPKIPSLVSWRAVPVASHYLLCNIITSLVRLFMTEVYKEFGLCISVDKMGHCRFLRRGVNWFTLYFRRILACWRMAGETSSLRSVTEIHHRSKREVRRSAEGLTHRLDAWPFLTVVLASSSSFLISKDL